MKLSDWLTRENVTLDEFGRRIGRTASTVSRIARGKHQPDWETMKAIARETAGAVEPNDFFERTGAGPAPPEEIPENPFPATARAGA